AAADDAVRAHHRENQWVGLRTDRTMRAWRFVRVDDAGEALEVVALPDLPPAAAVRVRAVDMDGGFGGARLALRAFGVVDVTPRRRRDKRHAAEPAQVLDHPDDRRAV